MMTARTRPLLAVTTVIFLLTACGAIPDENGPATTATVTATTTKARSNALSDTTTAAHPAAGKPSLGNKNLETFRDTIPVLENVSDESITDAADATCTLLRNYTPMETVDAMKPELPDFPDQTVRLFALTAQLEFCPETIDPELFEN